MSAECRRWSAVQMAVHHGLTLQPSLPASSKRRCPGLRPSAMPRSLSSQEAYRRARPPSGVRICHNEGEEPGLMANSCSLEQKRAAQGAFSACGHVVVREGCRGVAALVLELQTA